jgi:serine/threonine protein phosphatase PrpC
MRTVSVGQTDVGRRRPHNEDSYLCDDDLGLYIVADGVGGNAKGEVASAESVDLVHSWVRRWKATLETHRGGATDESTSLVRRLLESAVQSACYMVFGMGQLDPRQKGMSSTLSSLLVSADTGFIAQVGDSRVYLARKGKVVQLTEDHTLVNFRLKLGLITPEEAANAPGKNVITRAVGHQDYVEVDTLDLRAEEGDRFLLCSDGLHGYLQDGELDQLLDGDRAHVASSLIELANERGGRDNITVIVCDIVE